MASRTVRDPIHGTVELQPHEWAAVTSHVFQRLREIHQTLSMAAKIHFIVVQQDEPTKLGEIPKLAKQLSWRISAQVSKSVELRKKLDLLTVT